MFVENLVHKMLLDKISRSLKIYKKNNSLFSEGSPETYEQQLTKYKTLASQITTLGGLLNCELGAV